MLDIVEKDAIRSCTQRGKIMYFLSATSIQSEDSQISNICWKMILWSVNDQSGFCLWCRISENQRWNHCHVAAETWFSPEVSGCPLVVKQIMYSLCFHWPLFLLTRLKLLYSTSFYAKVLVSVSHLPPIEIQSQIETHTGMFMLVLSFSR